MDYGRLHQFEGVLAVFLNERPQIRYLFFTVLQTIHRIHRCSEKSRREDGRRKALLAYQVLKEICANKTIIVRVLDELEESYRHTL